MIYGLFVNKNIINIDNLNFKLLIYYNYKRVFLKGKPIFNKSMINSQKLSL